MKEGEKKGFLDETKNSSNSLLIKIEKKEGFFDKIKKYIPFFNTLSSKNPPLTGRIQAQIQKDAREVIEKLNCLREMLRKEYEEGKETLLWQSFETVAAPLLREYALVEKKLHERRDLKEGYATALKNFQNWIKKAKFWTSFCINPYDREGIVKAIINHTKYVYDSIIDRDIKSLHKYMNNELNNLDLPPQSLILIAKKLDEKVQVDIERLLALKNKKMDAYRLEELQNWKMHIDAERASHYEAALQKVDTFIHLYSSGKEGAEDHEPMKESLKMISYLEQEIPIFAKELQSLNEIDAEHYELLKEHAFYLEEQIHQLNKEMLLSPELSERVHVLSLEMAKIRLPFD